MIISEVKLQWQTHLKNIVKSFISVGRNKFSRKIAVISRPEEVIKNNTNINEEIFWQSLNSCKDVFFHCNVKQTVILNRTCIPNSYNKCVLNLLFK